MNPGTKFQVLEILKRQLTFMKVVGLDDKHLQIYEEQGT